MFFLISSDLVIKLFLVVLITLSPGLPRVIFCPVPFLICLEKKWSLGNQYEQCVKQEIHFRPRSCITLDPVDLVEQDCIWRYI